MINSNEAIKYTLNGLLAENKISPDGEEGKILMLVSNGSADLNRIVAEMQAEYSGLKKETIAHVLGLFDRVVTRLLLSGNRVNTGLFNATAAFKGSIKGSTWNSAENKIIVKFSPGVAIREAIKDTNVNVVAQKGEVAYIANVLDRATGLTNGTASQGFPLEILGNKIKVEGDDELVGVSLVDVDGAETKIDLRKLTDNDPSRVVFVVPEGLKNGVYYVRLTTMHCGSGQFLKAPRTVEKRIFLGISPEESKTEG